MTPLPDEYPEHEDPQREAKPAVRWDASGIRSVYANVCNVTGTREEVVLDFGIHHGWEQGGTGARIQLSSRVVLSPYACKRLAAMLEAVTREYEARYGSLAIESEGEI